MAHGMEYSKVVIPEHVIKQFMPRGVNDICVLELLAIPLLLATRTNCFGSSRLAIYIDKAGVVGAFTRGSSKAGDYKQVIRWAWVWFVHRNGAVDLREIVALANIADWQSRGGGTFGQFCTRHLG